MLAELYVLTGRDAGKGITAAPGVPTIFVGRAATNHIRVRDPQASRVHCRVDVTAEGLVLHDNNSGNGTYVNGELVTGTRRLEDHDEIQLGETRIAVLVESPEERARWHRGDVAEGSDAAMLDASSASSVSSVSSVAVVEPERARDPEPGEEYEGDDDEDGANESADAVELLDDEEVPADAVEDDEDAPPNEHDREATIVGTVAAHAASAPPAAAPGAAPRRALREVVPGYRIEARLGGHGRDGVAVYRAQQVSLERPVALKVLLANGPARDRDIERFLREAKAIARLPHPNIVTIHDAIARGALRVIVMEFVGGGSLADLIEGGALAAQSVLRVGEAVARALAYAHAHEVVHRNVKPSNILYGPELEAYKLADFGLATAPDHARAGDTSFIDLPLKGLAFVPPELLREAGARGPADPRSDVYALGATLYACAAGRAPFVGDDAAVVAAQVLHDAPAPIAGLPRPLSNLLARALAKDPAERYPDGAAMLHEVRACMALSSTWSSTGRRA